MLMLSQEAQQKAEVFVLRHARPLEQARFANFFRAGATRDVIAELTRFQNADGGFGNGLEPDLRLPDSSAIATTVAFQILREIKCGADHPVVQNSIQYLVDTFDPELQAWPIIPSNVDDAPHAPWWSYHDDLAQMWGGFLANPRAEIVGYLYDYAELVPPDLLVTLSSGVMSHLDSMPDAMERHDLACYLRLAETPALPDDARTKLLGKLERVIETAVTRDPDDWTGYSLKPLDVVNSPTSPFAPMLALEIELNLNLEIKNQGADGSWAPSWSWGDDYPEAWDTARREWQGIITVRTLKLLQHFGRLK